MAGETVITIVGNLTADPELRTTSAGAQGRLTQRSYEAKDGTQRTVVELQVDEIGPSLKYATAQVQKMQSGGYQGGNTNGGFGGNGYQQPQQAQQQPQGADPWAAPTGTPDSFGGFGGAPEPEF